MKDLDYSLRILWRVFASLLFSISFIVAAFDSTLDLSMFLMLGSIAAGIMSLQMKE